MLVLTEREKYIIGRVSVHKDYEKMMYMISTDGNRYKFFREMAKQKNYSLSFEKWFKTSIGYVDLKNGMYITGGNIKEVEDILKRIFKEEKIKSKDITRVGDIMDLILKYL